MFGWNENTTQINSLIQKKKYEEAVKLLRGELQKSPDSTFVMQQLANTLAKTSQVKEALQIMNQLAGKFSLEGFLGKALSMYKQMERLHPNQYWIQEKITALTKASFEKSRISMTPRAFDKPKSTLAKPILPPTDEGIEISDVEEVFEFEVSADRGPEKPNATHESDPIFSSPLFKGFSEDEVNALIQGLELRTFEPGEILFSEGEEGHSLMVLSSGDLRVYVRNQSGRQEQVRILSEGAFFGEISLLSRKRRTATIVAMSFVEILELDRASLAKIARDRPEIPQILKEYYLKRVNSPEEQKARKD